MSTRADENRFTKKISVGTPVSPRYLKVREQNFKFLRSHSNRAAGLCLQTEDRRDSLSELILRLNRCDERFPKRDI
jgi:hypothetical protein